MRNFVEVSELAAKQGGIITREQVLALGFHVSALDRAIASNLLVRQLTGVYRLASVPVTRAVKLWSALLWAGDGAVLSHLTAASLWKLEGLGLEPPDVIDVTVRRERQRVAHAAVRLHRTRVLVFVKDYATLDGFPCTSLARTLVDLASVLTASDLEHAFDSAVRRSQENRKAVLVALRRLGTAGRLGANSLSVIANREELGCTQSWLELKVRQALRRAKVPLPMPQLAIDDADGQIGIFDFAWPNRSLVICVDGWQTHAQQLIFEKDRSQWARLIAAGWFPLPITWRRLKTDEAGFVKQVKHLLATGKPISVPDSRRSAR